MDNLDLKEFGDQYIKLLTVLSEALDKIGDAEEQHRKIKMITVELKDFNDKILTLAGEYPIQHAKGYVPDSTGDADYLKEVPANLKKFNNK